MVTVLDMGFSVVDIVPTHCEGTLNISRGSLIKLRENIENIIKDLRNNITVKDIPRRFPYLPFRLTLAEQKLCGGPSTDPRSCPRRHVQQRLAMASKT